MTLLVIWFSFRYSYKEQGVGLTVMGPFQLKIFYDSTIYRQLETRWAYCQAHRKLTGPLFSKASGQWYKPMAASY